MVSRDYQEITILIPGYSIEDLPTDLNETSAASLLNAFAVAWHPHLLARSNGIPGYQQAEATDLPTAQQIIFLPECSEEWLGHDWQDHFSDTQSVVFSGCSSREEWLAQIREKFDLGEDLSSDILDAFFALGTCNLQVSWLSRRMHYFVDPDSYLMESEAQAAAEAAIAGDIEKMNDHLRRCFECVQECREQFQPTDCYLLDMCMPSEQNTSDELQQLVSSTSELTLVCSGQELQQHCESSDGFCSALKSALEEKRLSLMCGQHHELRTSLSSVSTLYADIHRTRTWLKSLGDAEHFHWARRRFGMTSAVPAVLSLFDVKSALHVALDDGIYPDREHGQMQWQAPDGSVIQAISRIPMAIDGASSFLRFADRFTESMQEDSAAVMLLARLPEVQSPWLQDLRIAASFAPVLGRFVTMTEFVDLTASQATPTQYDDGEYLSPYLIQSSVLKTESPVTSPAELHLARAVLESTASLDVMTAILNPKETASVHWYELEAQLNDEEAQRLAFDGTPDAATQKAQLSQIQKVLQQHQSESVDRLVSMIPDAAADVNGICLINPLSWKRSAAVSWPPDWKAPVSTKSIREARRQDGNLLLYVDVPSCGFVWLTESADGSAAVKPAATRGKALAEGMLLRNNTFEVQLNETTGGITSVTFHEQRANRVSQQVAFRYENSRTYFVEDEEKTTSYATQRLVSSRVLDSGPMTAAIESACEIVDVATGDVMARFRQTVSIDRISSRLHLLIEFDDVAQKPVGNPWMTYYAARFAWENESASIVRSVLGQARGFRMERFEAPDFVEIADVDTRLAISPHGRPYHRRSGHRMLDSLLIVEGEEERRFEFTLDFDQAYPMRVATESQRPLIQCKTGGKRPKAADSAWILGLSAKNVAAPRIRAEPAQNDGAPDKVVLLLQETEGRSGNCSIHTARPPKSARLRRPDGETLSELDVTAGSASVHFERFQIKEVELTF